VSAYLNSQVEILDTEDWENYRTGAARVIASFAGLHLVRRTRTAEAMLLLSLIHI